MLTTTLGQINFTVGDVSGNVGNMIRVAREAKAAGSELVVFPELSLTGYDPGDLLEDPTFLASVECGLQQLVEASRSIPSVYWVVGAPTRNPGSGKPLQNSLLVLHAGEVLLSYAKQLLPTYTVFNDRRYFEPGPEATPIVQIQGVRIGLLICEDGWNDDGKFYPVNPLSQLAQQPLHLAILINASPSHLGKRDERHRVFAAASRRHQIPLLCVNQVGGHDQVVYDGASFAVEPQHGVTFEAARFK